MSRATHRAAGRIEGDGHMRPVPERTMPTGPPNHAYEVTASGSLASFEPGVHGHPSYGSGDEFTYTEGHGLPSTEPWMNGPYSDRSVEVNTGGLEPLSVEVIPGGLVPVDPMYSPSVAGEGPVRPDYGIGMKLNMPFFPGPKGAANEPIQGGDIGRVSDILRSGRMGPQPIFPGFYTNWERPDPTEDWKPFPSKRQPVILE